MVAELVSALCMLAIVVVAVLIMTQAVSLEALGKGIARCLSLLMLALITLGLLKTRVLPILICAIVWLKGVMVWAFVIVLAVVALVLLLRVLLSRLANRNSHSNSD